ncbi:MAG: hypothetical protein N5P05_001636 [Chroococcopsis gigantea SAG 12.99]|jgi:hypothetical protein|nr:hypothetical protein [Chroococcopsis gigantea SAG 12.99]
MARTFRTQHLSQEAIAGLIKYLPDYIKDGLLKKSNDLECSLETTIEMAIANFLAEEALSFEDCLLNQRLANNKE